MLPTGGDGSAVIKWNASSKQWEVKTGNTNRMTVSDSGVTFNNDVVIPGGAVQTFTFYLTDLLQNQATIMTASVITSGSDSHAYQSYTRIPMVRSGSILGMTLYSEDGLVISGTVGALTASVTLDGANTAVSTNLATGSAANFIQAKDTTTFNGGQAIGVSLTASDEYEYQHSVDLASASGSWTVAVLVEM